MKCYVKKTLAFPKKSPKNKGCITSWLICHVDIITADAITRVYKLACSDNIKDVGLQLKDIIHHAFKSSKELTWPPTMHNIPDPELPKDLQQFLNHVLDGQETNTRERTKHLVQLIGQDICHANTGGQWRMSKQILLHTTIRHLYSYHQLIINLIILGH